MRATQRLRGNAGTGAAMRAAAWLALVAVLVGQAAAAAHAWTMRAGPQGAPLGEICSSGGERTDPGRAPPMSGAGADACVQCALCAIAFAGDGPPPAAPLRLKLAAEEPIAPRGFGLPKRVAIAWAAIRPRAPPPSA